VIHCGKVAAVLAVAVGAAVVVGGLTRGQTEAPQDIPSPTRSAREREVSPLFEPALASSLLEAPDRDRWQKPDAIVQALGIRAGDVVADVGAGSGYLMSRLSTAVGPRGTVYAEEIQEAFVRQLRQKAKGFGNVKVVTGTANDARLPSGRIDHFVLLTVYHEVQKPVEFLRILKRFAAPGARLAIIDFDARRRGTPPAPMGHEMAAHDVIDEAQAAGWRLAERHEFLSSQFFLVFRVE
jgi:arsenite methyltransferase